MKMLTAFAVAAAVLALGVEGQAAQNKNSAQAQREASCKAQAAKKYSAIHFLKRRDFVERCMGRTPTAKKAKAKPSTTGQR